MENVSFKDFLWQQKGNRLLIIVSIIAIVIQFSIFKYFYPSAGFIDGDSYVYLTTAFWNLGINTYMVGYSMFLRFFSIFTTSDFALVALQYFFIEFSALLLLFTIFYFFNPVKAIKYILLFFIVINPLFLYMANYVSSDGFFLSLSLIWCASLLWIIFRPSKKLIYSHCLLLFVCFTVRYNALFYPFIFTAALIATRTALKTKLIGLALSILLVGSFIVYNGNEYKKLTGIWQYSPFSGWQLANNAMYAYRYVDSAHRKPVKPKFADLDKMVRNYFDTTHNPFTHPEELLKASTVYMWDPRSVLYKYRNLQFMHDSSAPELKKWASLGPFYAQYGISIILQYPSYFLKYFIWPNSCKYYAPPVEFLEKYNSGEDSVKPPAVQWFGYKTAKRMVRVKDLKVNILDYYPILTGTINVIYILTLICLISLDFFRLNTRPRNGVIIITLFWLGNACFTIFSSSAALRFQAFPIVLTTVFSFVLIDIMYKTALKQELDKRSLLTENIENKSKEDIQYTTIRT